MKSLRAVWMVVVVTGCGASPGYNLIRLDLSGTADASGADIAGADLAGNARDLGTSDLAIPTPAGGEVGAPCVRNADCKSMLCLQGSRCSKPCVLGADCASAPDSSWGTLP